jgi:hypothetical protein
LYVLILCPPKPDRGAKESKLLVEIYFVIFSICNVVTIQMLVSGAFLPGKKPVLDWNRIIINGGLICSLWNEAGTVPTINLFRYLSLVETTFMWQIPLGVLLSACDPLSKPYQSAEIGPTHASAPAPFAEGPDLSGKLGSKCKVIGINKLHRETNPGGAKHLQRILSSWCVCVIWPMDFFHLYLDRFG